MFDFKSVSDLEDFELVFVLIIVGNARYRIVMSPALTSSKVCGEFSIVPVEQTIAV